MKYCPKCKQLIPDPLLACVACAQRASEIEVRRQQIIPLQMVASGKADLLLRGNGGVRHVKLFGVDQTFCGRIVERRGWRGGRLDYRLSTLEGICPACRDAVELAMKEAENTIVR